MTEIEKQFFEAFGIEAKMLCECSFKNLHDYRIDYGSDVCIRMDDYIKNPCDSCELAKQIHPLYPSITDRVLLELICILPPNGFFSTNTDDLKIEILTKCLKRERDENIRKQIRALFTEAGE